MRTVAAVALALLLATACAGGPSRFDDETAEAFVRACAEPAEGDGLPEDVCRCAYEALAEELTFEEFQQVNDDIEAAEADGELEPDEIPDVVADAFAACAVEPDPDPDPDSDSETTTTTLG